MNLKDEGSVYVVSFYEVILPNFLKSDLFLNYRVSF